MIKHIRLVEEPVAGKRLGRNIEHDQRSLNYLVPTPSAVAVVSTSWARAVPVFNQGDVGSCTGNALAGAIGSVPFYPTLPIGLLDDETLALALYSAAEKIDGGAGYPPEDEGSSGLSVAKAAKAAGYISGYQHITNLAAAHVAIQAGPFIVGSYWYAGMDTPSPAGVVQATGVIRGGHEYECFGYDAIADLWWFWNSWGEEYGRHGAFAYSSSTFTKLLAQQGDATVLVPLDQPAPVPAPHPLPSPLPIPQPAPIPVPWPKTWDMVLVQSLPPGWEVAKHTGANKTAAAAVAAWRKASGL